MPEKVSSEDNRGVALIMVLWVLAILMALVLSFSFAVRVETGSTLAFKEDIQKRFLAEAGIERGIMEVFYRSLNKEQKIVFEGMEVWKVDGAPYNIQTDNGFFTVRLTDESGKIDINTVPEVILKNFLLNFDLEMEDVDIIVDSVMDWKDPDELYRLNGAESDYYMSLAKPYKAKNAPFSTVEELMLVRGMTADILYGNEEKKGIIDFLTVSSGAMETINVNAAPKEVLTAVPGITSEIADEIISLRQAKEISLLQAIKGIPEVNYELIEPYLSMESSNIFTVESVGYKGNNKSGYGIKAVINFTGDDTYEYLYYKKGININ